MASARRSVSLSTLLNSLLQRADVTGESGVVVTRVGLYLIGSGLGETTTKVTGSNLAGTVFVCPPDLGYIPRPFE